jgi:hypothetical protein
MIHGGYTFSDEEKPLFPGAPYSPRLAPRTRVFYAITAFVMAIASGLANGIVTSNIANIAGNMGLYVAEANILLGVYVAFNAAANLLLVKARMQFGIPATMRVVLGSLLLAEVIAICFPSFGTALLARAVSGIANGGLTTLGLYSLFQVFPLRHRPMASVIGFSLPQLAIPLARMVSIDAVGFDDWLGFHLIELASVLTALALLNLLPLPPTDCIKAFEPLDAATIVMTIVGMLAGCTALALGRFYWWTETPWIGWALAAALLLGGAVFWLESRRQRPLLQIRWYGTGDILLFTLIAVVIRVALTEQTYAAVGLLSMGGLTNDQLHGLFAAVFAAMAAGIATAALVSRPERLLAMMMCSALVIAFAAWLDTHSTSDTRATQLYISQSLLGFGTTLFLGPALLYGVARIIQRGRTHLVSFVVLFSTTQNVGGLGGAALLASIQAVRQRVHAEAIADSLSLGDPAVLQRLGATAERLGPYIGDPSATTAQASAQLGQALQAQAAVLAFNDTFWVVSLLALALAAFLAIVILSGEVGRLRARGPTGATT